MLNMYNYKWVHKMGINLNFATLRIQMPQIKLVVMYMYGRPLKHVQFLYLYGSITKR